jgi:thiosulfate dehydrogenase
MTRTTRFVLGTAPALALGGLVLARAGGGPPSHATAPSANGNVVVELCDGQTKAEIAGVKEGETPTPEQARAVADQLMAEWRRKNPDRWDDVPVRVAAAEEPATGEQKATPPKPAPATPEGIQEGQTYGAFSERDERIWQAATAKFVEDGKRIFHSAKEVGGTIAVSCDMCHPDASNTHPETYPKFQVQLGRVALLRDMINWCIQNPARGKPFPEDDVRLKALEAYILAQRKGAALDYGKH